MDKGQKHHFIPEFYLKQWGNPGDNGCLVEFCRRYKDVEARPTFAGGTGYVRGLYSFNDLDIEVRNLIENEFLKQADDKAALALQHLVVHNVDLKIDLKNAWSRFIMTLLFRNPEAIERLKKKVADGLPAVLQSLKLDWKAARRQGDPQSLEEFSISIPKRDLQQAQLMFVRRMMDNESIGNFLNNMVWGVMTFHRPRYPLLISDRPYIMTDGLNKPGGHIMLPISSSTVFIAAYDKETIEKIDAACKREDLRMNEKMNKTIVSQARKFVWANDKSQINLVAKYLGKQQRSTPFEWA